MGKRGMLPKFRPAALGRDVSARPSIRPVRPSPPPPPPSPPRRNPSGVLPRTANNAEVSDSVVIRDDAHEGTNDGTYDSLGSLDFVREDDSFEARPYEDEIEAPTATALPTGNTEPSTLDRGLQTIPRDALPDHVREELSSLSFEEDTQARAVDDRVLDKLRHAEAPSAAMSDPDFRVDYESLPSLEVRRPYDAYEAAFRERDPVTQIHREASDSVQEPSFPAPITTKKGDPDYWGKREESGPRERPAGNERARSYAAPVPAYDDGNDAPQWGRDEAEPEAQRMLAAPRPPRASSDESDHPVFARAVQPIRTATPDAWSPQPMPPPAGQYLPSPMLSAQVSPEPSQPQMPPAYIAQPQMQMQPQGYPQPQHSSQPPSFYPQQGQVGPSYPPGQIPHMAMHNSAMPAAMQSMQFQAQANASGAYQPPSAAAFARAGRSGWFVAGAAFGIMFAFFATGIFNGRATKDAAPVATALAAPTAPAVAGQPALVQQAVGQQPGAQPMLAQPGFAQPGLAQQAFAQPGVAQPGLLQPAVVPPSALGPAGAAPAFAGAAPVAPTGFAPAVAPAAFGAVPPVAAQPAPPVAAPRVAAAPPPARPAPPRTAPRPPPPRHPSQASNAPKNLGGGGPGADDTPSGGGDIGDLLGAGLNP
jgi:hypothetical protein